MQAQITSFRSVRRAFEVLVGNLGVFLPLAIVLAIPSTGLRDGATALLMSLASGWLPAHGIIIDPQQGPILAMALADILVLPWICISGAFASTTLIHVFMQAEEGKTATLNGAISYGLSSWRRLIVPYTLATLVIWVGSIVIIPGILYTLFYAFVAPVAVLDPDVRHVLRRSTRLTRGRRGRIFRVYLWTIWWWGWYATVGALLLAGLHWSLRHLLAVGNELVGFAIGMALLQLYLERMKQLRDLIERQEQKQGQAQPRGTPIEPK